MFPGFNPFGTGFTPSVAQFPQMPSQSQGAQQGSALSYDPASSYFVPQDGTNFSQGAWQQTPLGAAMTAFYKFKGMQQQHGVEQAQWFDNARNDADYKKAKIFEESHYQTGENNQFVFDEKGNPVLEKGAESADQKKARTAWEKAQQDAVTGKYNQQSQDVTAKLRALQAETQANPSLLYDPKYREEYVKKFAEVSVQSSALDKQYLVDVTKAGNAHLPDADNPDGNYGNYIDGLFGDFAALKEKHHADELATPEGQLLTRLSQQYTDYMQLLYPTPQTMYA